jgi:AbiV family abortive infection protein
VLSRLDRVHTAFVLACFAADEYGKHILVTSFPGRDLDNDEEWNKLWRRFRLHEEKLGNALLHAWWDDLFDLGEPASSIDFHSARLRATYVDLGQDNSAVLEPHEAVSRDELDCVLEQLTRSIGRSEKLIGAMSTEGLAEVMRRVSESDESRRLRDEARTHPVALPVRAAIFRARLLAKEFGEDPDEAERRVQGAWAAVSESREDEGRT